MIISETFSLHAPRDRVAALLLDVENIQSCVPGVTDVAKVSDNEYRATLSTRVGPVTSAFRGTVTVDPSESPVRLRATARGKDRASGSLATVAFEANLVGSTPDVTTVETTADVTIRGRLGGFGTGVIRATAKQMIEEFVSCVGARLTTGVAAPSPPAGRPLGVVGILFQALRARLRSLFKRSRESRRREPS